MAMASVSTGWVGAAIRSTRPRGGGLVTTGAMGRTNRDIRHALERACQLQLTHARKRRCLEAIDDCLTRLEELHAHDQEISRREGCRRVVAELAEMVREDPPEPVQKARNSYDLHSALLNWESGVLDALVPGRRERFPDLSADGDDWPRRRRRRHRTASALAPA